MTWGCPNEVGGECVRIKRKCSPGAAGCVLYGMVEPKDEEAKQSPKLKRR